MHLLAVDMGLYIPGLLLCGAATIVSLYHIFLYLQYKEKIIIYYSFYLLFIGAYIACFLYADWRYPGGKTEFIYYAKESTNVAAIMFYCMFLAEAVGSWRSRFPRLFRLFYLVADAVFIYCILYLLAGILQFHPAFIFDALPTAVRVFLLLLGLFALPLLFPLLKEPFLQLIKWGALIYMVMVLLVMATRYTPGQSFLGIRQMQFFFIGTFIDIIIFSIAMGYKVKSVFTQILEVRNKISQDLHDDVGATLSGIALYSHLVQQQIKEQDIEKAGRSLETMKQTATQMVNRLSDMVWAVDPRNDNLAMLLKRVEEYALEMATVKNIQVNTQFTEKIKEINLPMEQRKNIYLICKESVNNAIKYSGCSRLRLEANIENQQVQFIIADNGMGFDPETAKRGNGLNNMQQRAIEMNTNLEIISKPEKGTTVRLKCKIT